MRGKEERKEEEEWAAKQFLDGKKMHVGKLGPLLGGYEEEREAERVRNIRRKEAERLEELPEEDEDTDEEEEEDQEISQPAVTEENAEETREIFLRLVKEKFIYGLLEVRITTFSLPCQSDLVVAPYSQNVDYDKVDWDEQWDVDNDRDAEERWFDEEEES